MLLLLFSLTTPHGRSGTSHCQDFVRNRKQSLTLGKRCFNEELASAALRARIKHKQRLHLLGHFSLPALARLDGHRKCMFSWCRCSVFTFAAKKPEGAENAMEQKKTVNLYVNNTWVHQQDRYWIAKAIAFSENGNDVTISACA
jgi:hypothetical protein